MSSTNYTTSPTSDVLRTVFDNLHDEALIDRLQAPRRGRPGHDPRTLWRAFIAAYALGLPSINEMIRRLEDDPAVASACGITAVPSKAAFSRFMAKLVKHAALVERCLTQAADALASALPNMGRLVAVDSTPIKGFSNPRKPSDPDCTVSYSNTKGFWHGYCMTALVDANYGVPVSCYVSTARDADTQLIMPALKRAKGQLQGFQPRAVLADAGYSARSVFESVRAFGAVPVIKLNRRRRKILPPPPSAAWQRLYNKRVSVEQFFGRGKQFYRLNNLTHRRIEKATIHCSLSVLVAQAKALARAHAGEIQDVRRCVRHVA